MISSAAEHSGELGCGDSFERQNTPDELIAGTLGPFRCQILGRDMLLVDYMHPPGKA